MEVYPLIIPSIDWTTLVESTHRHHGDTLSRTIDRLSNIGDLKSFIVGLDSLTGRNPVSQIDSLTTAIEPLRHLHFSFAIVADLDTISGLIQKSDFAILIAKSDTHIKYAVASGSLRDWERAITSYLNDAGAGDGVRQFYDTLVIYFQSIGLGDLWAGIRKRTLRDGTFLLEDMRK